MEAHDLVRLVHNPSRIGTLTAQRSGVTPIERVLKGLVLGLPEKSDLIWILDAQGKDPESLRNTCIDLIAYNNQKRR